MSLLALYFMHISATFSFFSEMFPDVHFRKFLKLYSNPDNRAIHYVVKYGARANFKMSFVYSKDFPKLFMR